MKKAIRTIAILALSLTTISCSKSKKLKINGEMVEVEPYGWANSGAQKIDGVVYQVSALDVVGSIIFCETIFVPIISTGYYLYEPVRYDSTLVR